MVPGANRQVQVHGCHIVVVWEKMDEDKGNWTPSLDLERDGCYCELSDGADSTGVIILPALCDNIDEEDDDVGK